MEQAVHSISDVIWRHIIECFICVYFILFSRGIQSRTRYTGSEIQPSSQVVDFTRCLFLEFVFDNLSRCAEDEAITYQKENVTLIKFLVYMYWDILIFSLLT